jgi:hypothetical protein
MAEGKDISYSIAMAANIPPPNPMVLTGVSNTNWYNFRDEFEDYALATGLHQPNEVQAANEEFNGQRMQAFLPAQTHPHSTTTV